MLTLGTARPRRTPARARWLPAYSVAHLVEERIFAVAHPWQRPENPGSSCASATSAIDCELGPLFELDQGDLRAARVLRSQR